MGAGLGGAGAAGSAAARAEAQRGGGRGWMAALQDGEEDEGQGVEEESVREELRDVR